MDYCNDSKHRSACVSELRSRDFRVHEGSQIRDNRVNDFDAYSACDDSYGMKIQIINESARIRPIPIP